MKHVAISLALVIAFGVLIVSVMSVGRMQPSLALQAQPTARIKIDTDRLIGEVDPHLFGNFAEHLGRCIYGGIFDEGNPLSDADGFRKDVMDATRGLGGDFAALARRQLCIRLQLERRHRPARSASAAAPIMRGAILIPTASARMNFYFIASGWASSRTSASMRASAPSRMRGTGWSIATKRATPPGAAAAQKRARQTVGRQVLGLGQ